MSDKKKVAETQRYKYLPTGEVFEVIGQRDGRGQAPGWNLRSEADPEMPCFATEEDLLNGRYQLLPARAR